MVAPQLDQLEGVLVIMTTRIPNRHERDSIAAAEYALGVLQGSARVAFATRIENEPSLAALVRKWDEHFTEFASDIAPEIPPQHIEKALEKRLFPDAQKASFWNSLGLWRGLTVASLAAVVAMGAWTLRTLPDAPTTSALVAQVAGAEGAVKLAAYYNPANGELRLNRVAGAAVSGRSLELWIIAGQDAPVSLGVLSDTANTRVVVPEALRGKFSKGVLAVSDEPAGGSPTGAPTGAVLATGALTDV
jgi:anti-sigma-K factor RskA